MDEAEKDFEKMLEVQINLGKMLQAKGAAEVQEKGADADEKALRMIETGTKIERAARESKLKYLREKSKLDY